MVYGKMLNQYKRTNVESAGKLQLVIMCYERAIQLLSQAKEHFREKEISEKALKLKKALNIIAQLQSSLDHEQGGQIARNLDSLYAYMTKSLINADIRQDLTGFDEAIRILTELNEGWKGIDDQDDHQPGINIAHIRSGSNPLFISA